MHLFQKWPFCASAFKSLKTNIWISTLKLWFLLPGFNRVQVETTAIRFHYPTPLIDSIFNCASDQGSDNLADDKYQKRIIWSFERFF